jgi:Acetyltransferase (GNAT) domain
MSPAYPIRPVSEAEFTAFYAVMEHAFNATYRTDEELRHDLAVLEFDRTLAAFDGADLVGTATAFTFRMSVPGDCATVAGAQPARAACHGCGSPRPGTQRPSWPRSTLACWTAGPA